MQPLNKKKTFILKPTTTTKSELFISDIFKI